MTAANVIIGSQVSYRAAEHMDTVQFCGQSCHVMKPEFTAHLQAPCFWPSTSATFSPI
jgi:hypothetical protein